MTAPSFSSKTYSVGDALEAIELYYQQGWTDGLPVVPPTEERVREFLEYSGHEPSDLLGVEPTKGWVITAEKVAVNAIMAGCRPEYMPVVVAAIEAICEPQFNLHAVTVSTGGGAVLLIINGPIAKELNFNSKVNLFGPGWRANATVGRAVQLVLLNVVQTIPGVIDKATLGHPGRYTFCFAEDEETSPWEPFHVERGFPRASSTVTAYSAGAPLQVSNHTGNTPEAILTTIAESMLVFGWGKREMLVVLSPEHMGYIRASDWSKKQVKQFLFQKAQSTVREWERAGKLEAFGPSDITKGLKPDEVKPVCNSAEGIHVLVGGGPAGAFSAIIPPTLGLTVTKEIHKRS